MKNPKISVIVPIYNTDVYLPRCLDSIINQTYKNLEIIAVDNGSTDNCNKICREYLLKESRICLVQKEHGTIATARNVGLKVASGDWISFIDSDDYIEPDFYEYLLLLAERTGAEIVQCGAFFDYEHRHKRGYAPKKDICISVDDIGKAKVFFADTVWCRIFLREVISDLCFETNFMIGEDFLFNLQAFRKANKTAFGNQFKYHYIQRNDSVCNAPPTPETLVSVRNMLLSAENDFVFDANIYEFCKERRMKNNLDMCSKIVRYRLDPLNTEMIHTIQHEMRDLCKKKFAGVSFTLQEIIKCILIAVSWNIYKNMLYIAIKIKENKWSK